MCHRVSCPVYRWSCVRLWGVVWRPCGRRRRLCVRSRDVTRSWGRASKHWCRNSSKPTRGTSTACSSVQSYYRCKKKSVLVMQWLHQGVEHWDVDLVVSVGDLERIVNLLLSLCSRMSRIDRSLLALEREELTQEDKAEEKVRQDRIYLSVYLLTTCLLRAWSFPGFTIQFNYDSPVNISQCYTLSDRSELKFGCVFHSPVHLWTFVIPSHVPWRATQRWHEVRSMKRYLDKSLANWHLQHRKYFKNM